MYSPVHATVGLLIATQMPDPVSAFAVGVGSHYLLDALPHGDTHFGAWLTGGHARRRIVTVEAVDLGLTAIIILHLITRFPERWWVVLVAGAIGGITPDLLWGARYVLDTAGLHLPLISSFLHHHDRWHSWGHAKHHYDIPFAVGLLLQATFLVVVLSVYL